MSGDKSISIRWVLLSSLANGVSTAKNLLLSEKARAEAIPELEVLSDDVSAAHGAASSSVDLEQIHYMMTRGFSRDDAQTEIVEGFLISSFAKTKNEYAKEFLIKALSTNQNEWE